MENNLARSEIISEIGQKLRLNFGCEPKEASPVQVFKACALVMRDIMAAKLVDSETRADRAGTKRVHYLSLEFLLGRSLEKNAYNLGVLNVIKEALREMGFNSSDFFEVEADAALGNGGLGRLAACYLEAMTTQGIAATGYSLLYEYGLFKQKILDFEQQELPDKWLDIDDVWLIRSFAESYTVRFGGTLDYQWSMGRMFPVYTGATELLASPADMLISGYHNDVVNRLRLWTARPATDMDMSLFSQGQYVKAMEDRAMAEVITKLLYPEDNHVEGKMLRLRQQYFFVSATIQDIVKKHMELYGTLENFADKHSIQINDTHPTFAIPELMRLFLDEYGYDWDAAWDIVTRTTAYTNHTIMSEALECWSQDIIKQMLPRVYDIILEIHHRFDRRIEETFGPDPEKKRVMSILYGGQIRMANLCVAACSKINGVSALHSDILKHRAFADAYKMFPNKFINITNGIDHRRWLGGANPLLSELVTELVGDGWLTDASLLTGLRDYADNNDVLRRLAEIKYKNKVQMAKVIEYNCGVIADPSSMFDVQAKRLHEYKRQLMNVLHILHLYGRIKDGDVSMLPRTFIFGAKAASGYHTAKRIIKLINCAAATINANPQARELIRIAFVENYCVSIAERLMPSAELSEQISLAGMEASGTGNMKFMMNGSLTIGTMDGANVEMCEQAGRENMFIFGMNADEAAVLAHSHYQPLSVYDSNLDVRRVIDMLRVGFAGESFTDLAQTLLLTDTYRVLADFQSYVNEQREVERVYRDPSAWNRMSLLNIASSGFFAADRSVGEYAKLVWGL